MHSFIIVAQKDQALEAANSIAPYQLKKDIDNFFVETTEKIGIDTVRDIKKFLHTKPYKNSHKIIYITDADQLTIQAQNSLLKTLEEPPQNSQIFLTTTNIDKLIPTVISRCQIIKVDQLETTKPSTENSFTPIIKKLISTNEGQRVSLASEHTYPKAKAISLCKDAIAHFRSSLHSQPNANTASNLKLASITLKRLEQNIDPRLSIEHFFIHLLV